MPTYSYACTVCAHRFETQQSFTEPSLTVCPECSGHLRKVFSSVGVVFKGSGFYRNDSRSGRGGKVKAGSTSASGESSSTSSPGASRDSGSATPAATPNAPAASSGGGKTGDSGSTKVGASSGASAASR